eukprot:COSAG01_NODE_903_length_12848_cov_7.966899_9_plen_131_part_00
MSSIYPKEFPVAKSARFSTALWAERSTQRHSPALSGVSGHTSQLSFMRHAKKTSVAESQTFAQLPPPPPAAVSITVAAARSLRAERIIASRCRRAEPAAMCRARIAAPALLLLAAAAVISRVQISGSRIL